MLCFRTSNNLITKTHERSLRLILNDHESSFIELLQENHDITNQQRNIPILLTEAFKTTKNLAPPIIKGTINARPNNYNLRKFQKLIREKKRTVKNELDTISYRASQLW